MTLLRHRPGLFVLVALSALLRAQAWGGPSAPKKGEGRPGGRATVVSGAAAAPIRVELKVPGLGPSLSAPSPAPSLKAPGVQSAALNPSASLPPSVLPAPVVLPGVEAHPTEAPGGAGVVDSPAGAEQAGSQASEALSSEGGRRFDRTAPVPGGDSSAPSAVEASGRSGGLWSRVAGIFKRPDIVPEWPGKPGDRVRVGGRSYVLGPKLGEGSSSVVYRVQDQPRLVLKLVYPDFKGDSLFGREAEALQALANADLAHAKLVAANADQTVIVKEFVEGESLAERMGKGDFRPSQKAGLMELAARLVSMGYTADLVPANLVWDHWRAQWVLIDGGGFAPAPAGGPVGQLLRDEYWPTDREKGVFLSGIRGRLGPQSPAWGRVVQAAERMPRLKRALDALTHADSERSPGPRLSFGPGRADPVLSDEFVSGKELGRRVGYDPFGSAPRTMLHTDDPGKLNTQVFSVEPPGKPRRVVKIASRDIIRKEIALRRIVRRFFGKYFDTPRSLAKDAGWDSAIVMEHAGGGPSYAREVLSLEQRVAFAVLARTFGLGDVNEGNVLYPPTGLPMLIDFEVALHPVTPVLSRIPDEGIVREMPWVSRRSLNRIEDYLPGIAAWREAFLGEAAQRAVRADIRAAGYSEAEADAYMAMLRANAGRLEWVLQADLEFANQFVRTPK